MFQPQALAIINFWTAESCLVFVSDYLFFPVVFLQSAMFSRVSGQVQGPLSYSSEFLRTFVFDAFFCCSSVASYAEFPVYSAFSSDAHFL